MLIFGMMRNLLHLCKRENLHKVFLMVLLLILGGSLAFWCLEPKVSFADSLWWAVVTSTTVGYGDISPGSFGGRIVGVLLMLSGIGFLGILTATVAGIFVENRIMISKGLKEVEVSGHYLICGWSFESSKVVDELRADIKSKDAPIVILADLPERPLEDESVHFIRGRVDKDNLAKACTGNALAAIVVNDDRLTPEVRDAKVIMDVLTIKNLYPDLYVCVELLDQKNVEHCRMAKADEIVVTGQLSTNLLVQGALDPGITKVVDELTSNQYGNDLYLVNAPESLQGESFLNALTLLKSRHGALLLGLAPRGGEIVTNPAADQAISSDDRLLIVAAKRPNLT